eukprot:s6425_g6.t1
MIYGRKIKPPGPRTDEHHQEPIKGNTGFYYVSGGRKPRIMQRMFNISIHWCNNRPGLDDQENFWDALVVERKRKPKDKEFFACFRHCDSTQCSGVEGDKVFDYCDMNPWEYIDGAVDPRLALQEPYHMVSYHSTWVIGKEAKQKKLKGELLAACHAAEEQLRNADTQDSGTSPQKQESASLLQVSRDEGSQSTPCWSAMPLDV